MSTEATKEIEGFFMEIIIENVSNFTLPMDPMGHDWKLNFDL